MKTSSQMVSVTVAELPLVPVAVELSVALGNDHYTELKAQLLALEKACADIIQVPPEQLTFKVGGTDAYKLITKTYHPAICAPIDIHIEVNHSLEDVLLSNESNILNHAQSTHEALKYTKVHFKRIKPISNGQFLIDTRTGLVFHPFPNVHPREGQPKPPFIDSRIFIYQHSIITPTLEQMMQEAKHEEDYKQLASVFQTYYSWISAGKKLSAETQTLFNAFADDKEKFGSLRKNVEKVIYLPFGFSFDQFIHYIKTQPNNLEEYHRCIVRPTEIELANSQRTVDTLTEQCASLEKVIEKNKEQTQFASIIQNLTSQQLSVKLAENNTLTRENQALTQQLSESETTLARMAALEAALTKANTAVEHEKSKNKQLAKENATLTTKVEKLTTTLEQSEATHQAELKKLTADINSLQSGMATLSRKNRLLQSKAQAQTTKQIAPLIEQPKREAFRTDFVLFILRMFSVFPEGEIPPHAELIQHFTEPTEEERKAIALCNEHMDNTLVNEADAIRLGNIFWLIFKKIKTLGPGHVETDTLRQILEDLDNKVDQELCEKNIIITAKDRCSELSRILLLMQPFLKCTKQNEEAVETLETLKNILNSSGEAELEFLASTYATLDKVGDTHHFLIKNMSVIREGWELFHHTLENPDNECDPTLIEKLPQAGQFCEGLLKHKCNEKEYELGVQRFLKTFRLLPNKSKRPFTDDEFNKLLVIFSEFHGFTVAVEVCFPLLRKYFTDIKKVKNNAEAMNAITEATFESMIKALKRAFPNANPVFIIEHYMYSLTQWTANKSNPQIQFKSPLIAVITPLASEAFITKLSHIIEREKKFSFYETNQTLAVNALGSRAFHVIPDNDRIAYLIHILDLVIEWPMTPNERDTIQYMLMRLNVSRLSNRISGTAETKPQPEKKELEPKAIKLQTAHILVQSLLAIKQRESNEKDINITFSFSSNDKAISNLTLNQKTAIENLAKRLPDLESDAAAKKFISTFSECAYMIAYIKNKPASDILTTLSLGLDHLDNSVTYYDNYQDYNLKAFQRFMLIGNKFKFIRDFLHDDNLQEFKNAQDLKETSARFHEALSNNENKKALIFELIEVGDVNRFLQKNITNIVTILIKLQNGQPLNNESMMFYGSWPNCIRATDSITKGELYFLNDKKNPGGEVMISTQQWALFKNSLSSAYQKWEKLKIQHPNAEIQVDIKGSSSSVLVTYPGAKKTTHPSKPGAQVPTFN